MWLALHDATLENGCLWLRPGLLHLAVTIQHLLAGAGSHRESVRRKYVRKQGGVDEPDVVMVFEDQVPPEGSIPWEGAMPSGW